MELIKKYTSELNKYFKQLGVLIIILSIISIILWFLMEIGVADNLFIQVEYTEQEFMPIILGAFVGITFLLSISGIYYLKKVTHRIIEILEGKSKLWLKHSNGDEVIFYKDLILYNIENKKKGKIELSGVSWDTSNLKDITLDLIKGEFPFSSLLPNVSLSSTKIKTFMIALNKHSNLSLTFFDLDKEKILIIHNKVPRGLVPSETTLSFPLENYKDFNKNDFDELSESLNKFCNYKSNYISQEFVDGLNNNKYFQQKTELKIKH